MYIDDNYDVLHEFFQERFCQKQGLKHLQISTAACKIHVFVDCLFVLGNTAIYYRF